MLETGTFSAVVDNVLEKTHRLDRVDDIVSYARATIRECAVKAFFLQDFEEDLLTATIVPFVWQRPVNVRQMAVVEYPYYTKHGEPIRPKLLQPNERKQSEQYWYYMSANSYVFGGIAVDAQIKIGYFVYPKRMQYYPLAADRPARFDQDTESWLYHASYNDTAATQETAREMVSHWLLLNWFDLIVQGTLAKLLHVIQDPRAGTTYSLFKSMQTDLLSGERHVAVPE